jgi:hypothetical protein
MKKLCFVIMSLLVACELQPAPKQAPPPAAGSAVVEAAPGSGSAALGAAATGSAAPPMPHPLPPPPRAIQPTAECQQAAIKVAELLINDAEPSQKPTIERERTDIVRNTEIACTTMGWTPSALACIAQSKSNNDAHACLEKFPPPTVAPAGGSAAAGRGSAVAPVPHPRPSSKIPH